MNTIVELNKIYCAEACGFMKENIPDNYIDLTVTSPPYDNLRTYNGFSFDFENIAKELFRITKDGGIVVWIVNDATIKGNETGTSFKQALYFKEIGFTLHDTMIYAKRNPAPVTNNRYQPCFEYMFVLTKGKPKTFNPIKELCKHAGETKLPHQRTFRRPNGKLVDATGKKDTVNQYKLKKNIWEYTVGYAVTSKDKIAYEHPAIFPEELAKDHILSWSNLGDIVFDPFMGSGTTAKMALLNNRNFIGCELSAEYVDIANKRINELIGVK